MEILESLVIAVVCCVSILALIPIIAISPFVLALLLQTIGEKIIPADKKPFKSTSTINQSYTSSTKNICSVCDGKGYAPGEPEGICYGCQGHGYV